MTIDIHLLSLGIFIFLIGIIIGAEISRIMKNRQTNFYEKMLVYHSAQLQVLYNDANLCARAFNTTKIAEYLSKNNKELIECLSRRELHIYSDGYTQGSISLLKFMITEHNARVDRFCKGISKMKKISEVK